AAIVERLPEIEHVERALLVDIDNGSVTLGTEADEAVAAFAEEVNGQRHAFADRLLAIDYQRIGRMQCLVLGNVQPGIPGAEAHLAEARAGAHQNREGARADF